MESELFLPILRNHREPGLRSRKNQEVITHIFFKQKIKIRGVFLSEKCLKFSYESVLFLSILHNRREPGLRSCKNQELVTLLFFK